MARQIINNNTQNETGGSARAKINANFEELYNRQDNKIYLENEFASYHGTLSKDYFSTITGGSEGLPDSGYEGFNGDNLCRYFGIGVADDYTTLNSDTDWIMYQYSRKYPALANKEKICITPKKPIASGGSWHQLYNKGVVYGDGLTSGEYGITTSSTDSTITDTSKAWTVDELAGKRVAIIATSRTGDALALDSNDFVILSNTADTITIDGVWNTANPSADNLFVIYDGVTTAKHHNRVMSQHSGFVLGGFVSTQIQDKWVEIDGVGYTIRLMEGGDVDTESQKQSAYGQNEWNTILYSLVDCQGDNSHMGEEYAIDNNKNVTKYKWENYNNDDVGIGGMSNPVGRAQWCQESVIGSNIFRRTLRGSTKVSRLVAFTSATTDSIFGFRPVLERR